MVFTDQQKKWAFLLFFLGVIILTLFILKNYLSALFVGILLAYFLYPIYKRIVKKVRKPIIAEVILSTLSLIVLFILLIGFIFPLISQTRLIYDRSEQFITGFLTDGMECENPGSAYCSFTERVKQFTTTTEFKEKSREIIKRTSLFFFQSISAVLSGVASFIISVVIIIFSLFYFLRHGQEIKETIMAVLPIQKSYKEKILLRLKETITAIVGGNITTALLQGIMGALIFWILGLPVPLFFGLIMAILAFIPAIGPGLVWIPTSILLFVQGNVTGSLILLIYSLLVLGTIDNIIKPKLIGDKIQLSSFWIFLGVIGGLQVFGILGLFFGPIIIALLVTCSDIYKGIEK